MPQTDNTKAALLLIINPSVSFHGLVIRRLLIYLKSHRFFFSLIANASFLEPEVVHILFNGWISSRKHWSQVSWDGGVPVRCKSVRCCHWCQPQNQKKALPSIQRTCFETESRNRSDVSSLNPQSLHRVVTAHRHLSVHGNRSCPDHLLVYMHLSQIKVYTSLFLPCSSHFLIYMIDFLCDLSSILSNILEV